MSTLEEVGPRPRSGRSSKKRQRVADTAVSAKANVEPPAVRIDGLPEDHALIVDCGIYERTETVVNGRAVWHQVDSAPPCDTFLFYSTLGSWCVSDEGDMLAGAHQGSMMTESDAATPDAIAETFVVVDDEQWAGFTTRKRNAGDRTAAMARQSRGTGGLAQQLAGAGRRS